MTKTNGAELFGQYAYTIKAAGENGAHGITIEWDIDNSQNTFFQNEGEAFSNETSAANVNILSLGSGTGDKEHLFIESFISTRKNSGLLPDLAVTFVDLKPQLPERNRDYPHQVVVQDAVQYLKTVPDNAVDIVFAMELIHFLKPEEIETVMSLLQTKLRDDGKAYISFASPFNNTAIGRDAVGLSHSGQLTLNERLTCLLRSDNLFASIQPQAECMPPISSWARGRA